MKKGEERGKISHFVNELVLTVDGDGEQIIYETPLKYVRPRMCDLCGNFWDVQKNKINQTG